MKKRFLALLLVLAMVLSLCACSKEETKTEEPTTTDAPTDTTDAPTDDAGDPTDAVDEPVDEPVELDPCEIQMYFHGSNVTDDTAVLEKVNEYTTEKLNCTFKPIWGTWGDFDQNAVLALQAGDPIDIYFTCSWSMDDYMQFAKDGYWVRLDAEDNNLIEKYATELFENTLPDVLVQGATVQGKNGYGIYAVPGYKDCATQRDWDVNVTRLTEMGHTVDEIDGQGFYEFGDLLQEAKDKYGDGFYPFLIDATVLEKTVNNVADICGDVAAGDTMSYYFNPDDVSQPGAYGDVIVNKFATEEFKNYATKMHEYYTKGYINPDCAIAEKASDSRTAAMLTGDYLLNVQTYSFGYETQASQERGIEVAMIPSTEPYTDTVVSQGAMMAISTASPNPDRAMMFLNLLNTDSYLMTLVDYGVEGIHYELNDLGEACFTDERANYQPWTNGVGNVTILPPQKGQGADFWDTFKAYYGSAALLPMLGFAFDGSELETEMVTVGTVVAKYLISLCSGAVDPADTLDAFLSELDAAGMQKIVDEANRQYDEFKALRG